ncbi:MAG: hypothetical protein KBG15_05535 [Kofleriaceae bacterium]|nr:hypothetical protein [Kofleriaceae bacterium]
MIKSVNFSAAWGLISLVVAVLSSCGGVTPRFPADVQTAFATTSMNRMETDQFVIYYPAKRHAQTVRFAARAEMCGTALKQQAVVKNAWWAQKMIITMPEVPFNNAFVAPPAVGYEDVAVVPTFNTLDFTTEFGLPPDPGYIACHEIVHYVHGKQIAGFWSALDHVFGNLFTPQLGFDSWFFEGLATHYEAALQPGVGRPRWPVFTGMFAAGFAADGFRGGDLSEFGRKAHLGHNYLFGTMFVDYLATHYGERPLWVTIGAQARSITGLISADSFKDGFAKSLGTLTDEFAVWAKTKYPVRARPNTQRSVATLGNSARYSRGRDGTEAWITSDVDAPARLVVRSPDGTVLAERNLTEVVPPRRLAVAAPLLSSGLSVTADGSAVYFTAVDYADITFTTRLMRWQRSDGRLSEVASGLGAGGAIDGAGANYYYMAVEGDRWSLARYELASRQRRVLVPMAPGSYVLTAQPSADGTRVVASVWNGTGFVLWIFDAQQGTRLHVVDDGTAVYDASFLPDGRLMHLGVVDGRFQVVVRDADGQRPHVVSNVPYGALAPRAAGATIRMLNRDGWAWTVDEIAVPVMDALRPTEPVVVPVAGDTAAASAASDVAPVAVAAALLDSKPDAGSPAVPVLPPAHIGSDAAFSPWDRFFVPQLHSLTLAGGGLFGAVVAGGDRLGLQRWSVTGLWQPKFGSARRNHFGGQAAYLNTMLAPWVVLGAASVVSWETTIAPATDAQPNLANYAEQRKQRDATFAIGRSWRNAWSIAVGGIYSFEYFQANNPIVPAPSEMVELGGAEVTASYAAFESTAYTGARRGVLVAGSAAMYPQQISTLSDDVMDVSLTLGGALPLPVGRRHVVSAIATARYAPTDAGNLLQLGGVYGGTSLWSRSNRATAAVESVAATPGVFRFATGLRGYEDISFAAQRLLSGELEWRYPLIIDRGIASTLWFLPASFLRQIDLLLFGSLGAHQAQTASSASWHSAVGVGVSLEFGLFRVPLKIDYQLSRRLVDDRALTQFVGLSAGW